ncbi:MAG: hypothetical protein JO323_02780 [Acidobacteriia bacterium]|nr:hypothetical protein [Terriglobia bacterium]
MWPLHGEYECRTCGRRYRAFGEEPMAGRTKLILLKTAASVMLGLLLMLAHPLHAAELQPETLAAWDAHLKAADALMQERAAGGQPFLWVDESPDRAARVRGGEVLVAPVVGHGTKAVPHGLIHDWIGTIFIPGATIDSLRTVVHNYDDYQQMYRPVVTSSRTLACADDVQEFRMVWQRKVLFVSAAMQGLYQNHDVMLDPNRGYGVTEAVEIREIQGYGHPDERLLPPNTGSGFIWRIRSITRYEERDGGVYLELEAMALTRDIPASVAWMVKPVVNHLSTNSLVATLRQTHDAVVSPQHGGESSALCPVPNRGITLAKTGGE